MASIPFMSKTVSIPAASTLGNPCKSGGFSSFAKREGHRPSPRRRLSDEVISSCIGITLSGLPELRQAKLRYIIEAAPRWVVESFLEDYSPPRLDQALFSGNCQYRTSRGPVPSGSKADDAYDRWMWLSQNEYQTNMYQSALAGHFRSLIRDQDAQTNAAQIGAARARRRMQGRAEDLDNEMELRRFRNLRRGREQTTLYRLWSPNKVLLYVGIAGNPGRRFEQHKGEKAWWGDVTSITLEHHPSRSDALDAERIAIRTESPIHNIIGVVAA